MIIDCFTFNGEYDLLEIRLNVLNSYVDEFIIVEFDKTFSGKPKPAYYLEQRGRYEKWWHKINYRTYEEKDYSKYLELAKSSPNTQGADHWKREFCQKECLKDALIGLSNDDIIFIGDVDEVWYPGVYHPFNPQKLKLKVYSYWLNNRSSEQFWGTLLAEYKDIKNECLNHLRSNSPKQEQDTGWHFTSMGGHKEIYRKLTDSYTEESYATDWVLRNLEENVDNNKDFLGRNFNYWIDESEWPPYLKDKREKYKHLLKPTNL